MTVVAASLATLTLLYFLLTTLADLNPLNNVRAVPMRRRAREVMLNAPLLALPIALVVSAGLVEIPWLAFAGGILELVVLISGIALWWLPYLAGRSVPWASIGTGVSWNEFHEQIYAHTIIVLPKIGERPRPNLEHMILHLLLAAASIIAILSALIV